MTTANSTQERVLLIKEMNSMKNKLINLRLRAIVSSLIVLPFMIPELVNRRNFNEGFPVPLFVVLWVLPIIFMATLTPIAQNVRAGKSVAAKPVSLVLRVAVSIFIVWFWGSVVMDQMPCFLGVPNCD
jgi:hypothetical protein